MDSIKSTAQQVMNQVTNGTQSHSGETILVTGASGFVAAHVLNDLLDQGYKVRGTVRSEESANKVRKTHAKYGDKLSFAIVKDVAAPGSFDEAVKGVDGVIHTASPFQTQVENNERDLLNPAIHGTREILQAIQKNNPTIKRVVITSSFASIINMEKGNWPQHTYTEADWNPVTYEAAKTADGSTAYCASKTFAEKAAFDFVEKQHPNFSIATICPPMVYGPPVHAVSSLDHLNTSAADIYRLINGSENVVPPTQFWAFADVRDVAKAHRLAYESSQAANQRFFITSGSYSYQMVCDVIRKNFPELKDRTPAGKQGSGLGAEVYKVSNEKAKKELGLSFRSLEETIVDTVRRLLELERETGKA
ncbi:MAG: methylglyoxal reductase (NADPH-dependent) gre2 [Pleopsidium flavum]|nr:MAG: methylglyoxal reductase (NADPH-dependent) gre2 [Pleopsidium flavum]KAI9874619.1 MAG: methylglyoxal reductase (NADPH-dependent) gre2 [Pleopsidium flavum]